MLPAMHTCLPLNTVCNRSHACISDASPIYFVCDTCQVPRALCASRGLRLSWWRFLWQCGRLGTLARSTSSSTLYGEPCSHGVVFRLSAIASCRTVASWVQPQPLTNRVVPSNAITSLCRSFYLLIAYFAAAAAASWQRLQAKQRPDKDDRALSPLEYGTVAAYHIMLTVRAARP
jgi:hypothetical protein